MRIVRVSTAFRRVRGQYVGEVEHHLGDPRVLVQLYRNEDGDWVAEGDFLVVATDGNSLQIRLGPRWLVVSTSGRDPSAYEWTAVVAG